MRVLIALLFIVLIYGCEDTKKGTVEKEKTTTNTETDIHERNNNTTTKISEEKNKEKTSIDFLQLTNENAVDFLTKYGAENPETKIKITTRLGVIHIELYEDTPLHRANFVYLVKRNYFENTFFHRVVPNFIIQGGNSDLSSTNKKRTAIGATYLLPAEINGRDVSYGSIVGAKEYRENPDKKTAPFEFFIFLGPPASTSHLNGNYTVFGKVTKGMNVVEKISRLDKDKAEWPLQNVYITAEIIH